MVHYSVHGSCFTAQAHCSWLTVDDSKFMAHSSRFVVNDSEFMVSSRFMVYGS